MVLVGLLVSEFQIRGPRDEGGEVKTVSFLVLLLVNHLLQQLIQMILVLQHGLPQNG